MRILAVVDHTLHYQPSIWSHGGCLDHIKEDKKSDLGHRSLFLACGSGLFVFFSARLRPEHSDSSP
jgi:hypothetical protein